MYATLIRIKRRAPMHKVPKVNTDRSNDKPGFRSVPSPIGKTDIEPMLKMAICVKLITQSRPFILGVRLGLHHIRATIANTRVKIINPTAKSMCCGAMTMGSTGRTKFLARETTTNQ